MLEDLSSEEIPEKARVMCHGYVTEVLAKDKLLNFKICDATSERECSMFVNSSDDEHYLPDDPSQIKTGVFMTVMAAKEIKEFRGETHNKLLVHRYRVIRDVDEQIHWAISTIKTSR